MNGRPNYKFINKIKFGKFYHYFAHPLSGKQGYRITRELFYEFVRKYPELLLIYENGKWVWNSDKKPFSIEKVKLIELE